MKSVFQAQSSALALPLNNMLLSPNINKISNLNKYTRSYDPLCNNIAFNT